MTADPRKAPSPGTGAGFTPGVDAYAAEGSHRAPGAGASSPSEKRLTLRSPRAALEPERVPEPQRPSRRARHPVVVTGSAIFTIILLAAIAVGFAVAFGKQRLDTAGPLEQSQIVNIPRNVGPRDIADLLQREGVIEQRWVFLGGILVMKDWSKLKSGEYEFKKQASLRDVIDTLVEGKVLQHHLTVPEGLTSEQVVQRLMDNDVLSGNIKEIPREGTVLPDTYSFPRGSTREQLIQHMQQEQRRLVQDIWNRRAPDLPVKSPEQLVVLASLIEKETGKPDERTRVAAVFVNRLKLKMRLQSDPTIIYGLVGGKGTLGRPILRSEIDQPTPYNTYVIDGLPPGPIANPGRASLEAAASPARTKELYFVADGTGGHAFAENLDQHQKNVARLRQTEQQKEPPQAAPSAPAAAPAPAPAAARQPHQAPARTAPAPIRITPSPSRQPQEPKPAPSRTGEAPQPAPQ
jgi:peptidoglycan lytic transglycosylase G